MSSSLVVSSVAKRYGHVRALCDVSLRFEPGEIHAVLGENGAGKSTLMGILAGFVQPDSGSVSLAGQILPLGAPHAMKDLGVAMVHQHFTLVPAFTVAENLALAASGSLFKSRSALLEAGPALTKAAELGWEIDPLAHAGDLPVGIQQRIEILKVLASRGSVLIFDEPTAVLTPDEVLDLFRVLRALRDEGKTIILIAHKLSEVMAIADRVSVLRAGAFVASAQIGDTGPGQLAEWMIGERATELGANGSPYRGEVVLNVENLSVAGDRGEPAVRDVSCELYAGEILGIGGVDGNGQVELAEALAGVRPSSLNPQDVAYIPQNRQTDGLALEMSIVDNLLITGSTRADLTIGPFLRRGPIRVWAEDLAARFDVKFGAISDPVSSLSGGNQQKVVVARTLDSNPRILVAVNPTRGLDIKATQFVHEQLRKAAAAGMGVVLFSTDLDELEAVAHRIFYLSRGELGSHLVGA